MGPQCFRKESSKAPVCGVHNVALVLRHSSSDTEASFFGDFDFFICPVSGKVVSEVSQTGKVQESGAGF